MDRATIRSLLEKVAAQEQTVEDALGALDGEVDAAGIKLDVARLRRTGVPEVVYGENKDAARIAAALQRLVDAGQPAIATRVAPEKAAVVLGLLPVAEWDAEARVIVAARAEARPGRVAVVSAGTSDAPVTAEVAAVLGALGVEVERIDDVGVAGIHRLLRRADRIGAADVVVVVAGMYGALPSAVAGLVDRPVVAVPTSVGYGASFGGVAALLTMLNSCAPGVVVVNIDNGFGAAIAALRFLGRR
jgi:NCAIR mutase (PurE)-related protein